DRGQRNLTVTPTVPRRGRLTASPEFPTPGSTGLSRSVSAGAGGLSKPDGDELRHEVVGQRPVHREVQGPLRHRVPRQLVAALVEHRAAVREVAEVLLEGG